MAIFVDQFLDPTLNRPLRLYSKLRLQLQWQTVLLQAEPNLVEVSEQLDL